MPSRTYVVAGGGASGALLARQLLERSPSDTVVIVEPREELGRGLAYSTPCPLHVLNVPAHNMYAIPEEPRHFTDWLSAQFPGEFAPHSFVPRSVYGDYLSSLIQGYGERLIHIRSRVTSVAETDRGVRVDCANGVALHADKFALALGNLKAAEGRVASELAGTEGYYASPWEPCALIPRRADESVVLIGTGLTAIDAVLGLRFNGHEGPIVMISRRGLLPHEHRTGARPVPIADDEASHLISAAREIRARGRRSSWRLALDALRPHTNTLWDRLSDAQQRAFLRHALAYWNVHRHRIAPDVVQRLAEEIAEERLHVVSGRIRSTTVSRCGIEVAVGLRGNGVAFETNADRIVDCTGPAHDFQKLGDPLLNALFAARTVTPSRSGIGMAVRENGSIVRDGDTSSRLFAIGPMRLGSLLETTAMPEIRVQARDLADTMIA